MKNKNKNKTLVLIFSEPLVKESPLCEEVLEKEQQVKTVPTMQDYLKSSAKSQSLIKGTLITTLTIKLWLILVLI